MKARSAPVAVTLLLVSSFIIAGELVGDKSNGLWVAGNFFQVNVSCTQAWQCIPGVDVLHDPSTVLVTTPNTSTTGVCSAGDGPADTCNVCLANNPKDSCQYWLEKK